ncbi:30S ribosomal protein S18 [Streptomyces sp. NBC_00878]|uniref:30S ribosomal protein S18 n=1 Tax=Streptomyces sp. NBC_00878 TaxID=2975854 RepID=UPI00224DCE5E|nr:30S ribosomal protein S18 [Streptomyces sp. NBC_00878]MCX4907745.1 30S ribosomal protein S18 [Streptomyces sp. NBC_00878]
MRQAAWSALSDDSAGATASATTSVGTSAKTSVMTIAGSADAVRRKFISDRGKIRSRRVTRVSAQQQRLLACAIKNAREMALLPHSSR